MQSQFRNLWRHAASPVTIITTAYKSQLAGMTISSLTSVSMGPPHLLVSFNCQTPSRTSQILQSRNKLVLNVLSATPAHALLAKTFAGRAAGGHDTNPFEQFASLFTTLPETDGIPVIKNASSRLLCEVQTVLPVQDHEIVVAKVNKMWIDEAEPMLYREHRFWSVGREIKCT